MAVKLWVSSSTVDADIFVILRVFTPDPKEVVFRGALDPHTPVASGWLRASHRKLDPAKSKPWQPWHSHDEVQPMTPAEASEPDLDSPPSRLVVPRCTRFAPPWPWSHYSYPAY